MTTIFDRRTFALGAFATTFAACSSRDANGASANATVRPDLYQCEGCEGVFETNLDTLGPYARIGPNGEPGEPLRISGQIFQVDGRRPAAGVVIYAYQTNSNGLYANGSNASVWSRRHGRLRGWIKTSQDGRYTFDTIKPAPYPRDTIPAHIHFTVLEPDRRPYWIDDIVFDGEFGVTPEYRKAMVNKGGNGIVRLTRGADGVWSAHRDIYLERHSETGVGKS